MNIKTKLSQLLTTTNKFYIIFVTRLLLLLTVIKFYIFLFEENKKNKFIYLSFLINNSCISIGFHNINFIFMYIHMKANKRESAVRILCSRLSTIFYRHCVLSGDTKRRALCTRTEKLKRINIIFISRNQTHNQRVYFQTLFH